MGFNFQGKRVVITGAGGGIGRALVAAFRNAGASIIACDRDQALLDSLPPDGIVERHVFDITDRAPIQSVATAIMHADVLVNNAGFTRADSFSILEDAAVDSEIQLNLTGVIDFTRALLPSMVKRGRGSIAFVSSVNAHFHAGNPVYSAAKAGQIAFSRAVAVEYGRFGIRSNVVCPGSVRTAAWEHRIAADPDVLDKLVKHYALGRIVTPEEVANSVLFLVSDLASGITGATLNVDAGLTAGDPQLIRDIVGGLD